MIKFKKSIVNFVLILMLLVLVGCGRKNKEDMFPELKSASYDLDLLSLNNDQEILNNFIKIYNNVGLLYGYSISLKGTYSYNYVGNVRYDFITVGEKDGVIYYIEIDFDEKKPDAGDEIEITGLIDYYYEDSVRYDRISVFNLEVTKENPDK